MGAARTHPQAAAPPKGLLGALIVVAVIGSVAPWIAKAAGLPPPATTFLEVVDHVVPGMVVVGASALVLSGRLPLFGTLIATLVAALAGLWMTATHVPLLWQARTVVVDWPTALTHSVPVIATFALTIPPAVWAWRRQAAVEAEAAAGKSSAKGSAKGGKGPARGGKGPAKGGKGSAKGDGGK